MKCDCNSQLHNALKYINDYGKGAVVYLTDHEGRGIGLCNKVKAYKLQEQGQDTIEANLSLGFKSDLRDYGTGAQILVDLGYTNFNLITNNPKKIKGLEGYGLNVNSTIKVSSEVTPFNQRYLDTKKEENAPLFIRSTLMYNIKFLTADSYGKFESLYEDFRKRAVVEYNFELEPLDYDGFFRSYR